LDPLSKKISEHTITTTRYAADKIELTIFFVQEPVGVGLFIMASTNATTASGNKNRYIPPREARPTRRPAKIKSVSKTAIFYSIVVMADSIPFDQEQNKAQKSEISKIPRTAFWKTSAFTSISIITLLKCVFYNSFIFLKASSFSASGYCKARILGKHG
jgi:hypothetical protein